MPATKHAASGGCSKCRYSARGCARCVADFIPKSVKVLQKAPEKYAAAVAKMKSPKSASKPRGRPPKSSTAAGGGNTPKTPKARAKPPPSAAATPTSMTSPPSPLGRNDSLANQRLSVRSAMPPPAPRDASLKRKERSVNPLSRDYVSPAAAADDCENDAPTHSPTRRRVVNPNGGPGGKTLLANVAGAAAGTPSSSTYATPILSTALGNKLSRRRATTPQQHVRWAEPIHHTYEGDPIPMSTLSSADSEKGGQGRGGIGRGNTTDDNGCGGAGGGAETTAASLFDGYDAADAAVISHVGSYGELGMGDLFIGSFPPELRDALAGEEDGGGGKGEGCEAATREQCGFASAAARGLSQAVGNLRGMLS